MTSSASYLLRSRIAVSPAHALTVGETMARRDRADGRAHATFVALDQDEVLELTAFEALSDLPSVLADRADAERSVTPWLTGEWRHDILGHVEDVIGGPGAITAAPMVEMRHIEVPPPVYPEYRGWREQTIYQAVRNRPEIDCFRSYQSVLSTQPGVMFVVGFSAETEAYWDVYRTPEYRAILDQAGSRYIANGLSGLECKTYARPAVLADRQARAA